MDRTQHRSNNDVLGAPAGWSQDALQCNALPVTRAVLADGVPTIASFWRPTAEEIAQLRAGGLVTLWIFGDAMPPVALTVSSP